MKIVKGKRTLFSRVEIAGTFLPRAIGLLGRGLIPAGYAMYFPRCNSIHTFFMKTKIDVIMISGKGTAVFLSENTGPNRIVVSWQAKDTIEMAAGTIKRLGIKAGDILEMRDPGCVIRNRTKQKTRKA